MTSAGYKYHVFLSYKRGPIIEEWIRDFFSDWLSHCLTQELNGEKARLFWDQRTIRPGNLWEKTICDAIQSSCCIVPVWTPEYFRSEWCVSEWQSFRIRGEMTKLTDQGLVVPIQWHASSFPKKAQEVEQADFTDYAYIGAGFKQSSRFMEFQQSVREFAIDVANVVKEAPKFDPDWPVFTPEKLREATRNESDELVLSDIFNTENPKIGRAKLEAGDQ